MSEQKKTKITITLARIQEFSPCASGWQKVLKANGGAKADLNKAFPVSSILDSNGLDDALWVLQCLPEYKALRRKFAWWSAVQVADNTTDKRVSQCLDVVKRYIDGLATKSELSAARSAARSAAWTAAEAAARSAARSAESAARSAQEVKLRSILDSGIWQD